MKISQKIKSASIIASIMVFTMVGTSFAYSSSFTGTFGQGNYIDGSTNGKYYGLGDGKTNVSGQAVVTNSDGKTNEGAYIEVRRSTATGSSKVMYLSTASYKHSINFKGSFTAKKGKHYFVLRKANRNYPGYISGTISQ